MLDQRNSRIEIANYWPVINCERFPPLLRKKRLEKL